MAATAFLIGIQQADERLGGISPWTLRKHIAQGHIRATRIGRRILLGKDELERIHREGLALAPDRKPIQSQLCV